MNGSIAHLPRSSIYIEYGPHVVPGDNPPTIAQRSAIVNGFFRPDVAIIQPDCPTGSCTYRDTYTSLAFCSRCTNVTN